MKPVRVSEAYIDCYTTNVRIWLARLMAGTWNLRIINDEVGCNCTNAVQWKNIGAYLYQVRRKQKEKVKKT
jgi:hypothetical protein